MSPEASDLLPKKNLVNSDSNIVLIQKDVSQEKRNETTQRSSDKYYMRSCLVQIEI